MKGAISGGCCGVQDSFVEKAIASTRLGTEWRGVGKEAFPVRNQDEQGRSPLPNLIPCSIVSGMKHIQIYVSFSSLCPCQISMADNVGFILEK